MATKPTVLLNKHGYIRIPSELLPEGAGKNFGYIVIGDPKNSRIELKPCGAETNGPQTRKAMFSNDGCKSPLVACGKALSNINIKAPKTSTSYSVKRKKDGTLIVQF